MDKKGDERKIYQTSKVKRHNSNPNETVSVLVNFAELLGNDWFSGRMKDSEMNMMDDFGCNTMYSKDTTMTKWLHEDGNWIYMNGGRQAEFRGGGSEKDDESFNNVMKHKPQKLKAYLVLNTSDEPTESSGSDGVYKYVAACIARLEKAKPGAWASIRPTLTDETGNLDKGIGLEGLIEAYQETNPQKVGFRLRGGDTNILSKSKTMADKIVQAINPKYKDYMDFLLDFTPEGLIDYNDIINALQGTLTLEKQLPRYFAVGESALIHPFNTSQTNVANKEPIQTGTMDDFMRQSQIWNDTPIIANNEGVQNDSDLSKSPLLQRSDAVERVV